ncbi:MAG: hypothetical protein R2865_09200 [Deinococcales bacterium]
MKLKWCVAYFPLDEMLYAAKGSGAYLNGRAIQVSSTASLDKAILSCTNIADFAKYGRAEGLFGSACKKLVITVWVGQMPMVMLWWLRGVVTSC